MRLTVLGGCGAWPAAGQACSGYLVEHEDFRLLVDPGYATFPRLLQTTRAELIDAVLISHGHADHCADLHPLLRARALGEHHAPALPIHSQPAAVDNVLALDRPGSLEDAYLMREFAAGDRFQVGPFQIETWSLPHFVPNAGIRMTADDQVLAYTGDTGPSPDLLSLARDAHLFLAEATFAERVPADSLGYLSSAVQAGENAALAGVRELMLTHLLPGSSREAFEACARESFHGSISIASPGVVIDLDRRT
jgi:ribonuclease BN (tRNA processing enzyme)